jgi:hypothetical protein
MARVFYLACREGRYYLQVRGSHVAPGLLNQPLFRTSLRTADHPRARRRVAECLGWSMGRMTVSILPRCARRTSGNCRRIAPIHYLLSDDHLFARRSYNEMLKNPNRRVQARDLNPEACAPS